MIEDNVLESMGLEGAENAPETVQRVFTAYSFDAVQTGAARRRDVLVAGLRRRSWAWSWATPSSRWTSPSTTRYRVAHPAGVHAARRWSAGRPSWSRPIVDELIDAVRRPRPGRARPRADVPVPGQRHRRPARPARGGPRRSSTGWTVELISIGVRHGDVACGASQALGDYFARDHRRAPRGARPTTSSACSPQAELDGQRAHRRRDHRLPAGCCSRPAPRRPTARRATCSSGCSRDPDAARGAARRPLAHAAGHRGGAALGAAAAHDHAHRDARHRASCGVPDPGGRGRSSSTSARPTTTRSAGTEPEELRHPPQAAAAHRLRASARTCASACTSPAWRRGSCSTRSSTGCPNLRLDPDGRAAVHHRHDVPGARRAAGVVRLVSARSA